MGRTHFFVSSLFSLLLLLASPAWAGAESQDLAQELRRLQDRVESLEAELTSLQQGLGARLSALEGQLASKVESAPAEEPAATLSGKERADLEAELAGILGESGGEPSSSPVSSGEEKQFTSRTRTLNQLNPEISVTGNVFGTVSDTPETNRFQLDELELALQAPLDPFASAKAFIVQEEGELGIEEAYIDWTALPGGLGLKFGQFRNDWGKLNRWHNHALPQVGRPLVHQALLGEEGLLGLGVSLSWLPSPFLGDYNELWVQVTNDENDVAFSGRGFDEPIFLIHETNYWDLSSASYIEVGLSATTGVNDDLGRFRTQVYGIDWNFDWRPPARALYKGLELRGELMYQRREEELGWLSSWGAYTYATYKLNRRWFLGVRGDWTQLPSDRGSEAWGVSPYFEWWQSEWTRLRVQYSYSSRLLEEEAAENRLFFQVTWSLGPHKHAKY